jgi:hypothetical protein
VKRNDYSGKREFDVDLMLRGYLTCALWSSHSDDGPLDAKGIDDIDSASVQRAREDCEGFVSLCAKNEIDLLAVPGMNEGSIGHDFWLTRNGHGAGFWDRGLGQLGDYLTKWAKTFGEADADLNEDGKVTIE